MKTGLTADEYGEITLDTYHDGQYSIYINDDSYASKFRTKRIKDPVFLTNEQVKEYIDEAVKLQTEQIKNFSEKVGL